MRSVLKIFKVGLLSVPLCLSACIGTAFLYEDDAAQGAFPSLHSVPDRPAAKDPQFYEAERARLSQDYEASRARDENNPLSQGTKKNN